MGRELTARRMRHADRIVVLSWLRDPVLREAVRDETLDPDRPGSVLSMLETGDPMADGTLCLVLESAGRPVGLCLFSWINWISRNAEATILVGPEELRGSLTAFRCLLATARAAFHALNLHKIYAFVYGSNGAAASVLRKVMTEEARLRRYESSAKGHQDMIALGMLASDFNRLSGRWARW